jgi:SAM-dependent MidA family methyltransferase
MQVALYEPGLGYYTGPAAKLGSAGDFVTAPEISGLFAQCLAAQLAQVLSETTEGDLLEIGGGTGILAAGLLANLEVMGCLPGKYYLLEVSADLRARQEAMLKEQVPRLLNRVQWLSSWPEPGFRGAVIANEVLDAMPVSCFAFRDNELYSRGVRAGEYGFKWSLEDPSDETRTEVSRLLEGRTFAEYESEWNPWLDGWISGLARFLEQGVIFLIDYGYERSTYYHPERASGTLICHYRHRVHDDPFYLPGLQDITASVDYTAVAESAVKQGLNVMGYTTQAWFLFGNGLAQRYEGQDNNDVVLRAQQAHEVRRLTDPGEMGERFKVMALGCDFDMDLAGFSMRDMRQYL